MSIKYKFDEDKYLEEILDYIKNTYTQHYATSDDGTQTFELIDSSGWGNGFVIGNIIKYASRYGRKSGYQRKDLLKIIHYGLLQLFLHDQHYPFNEKILTQERLKEVMHYDPVTGIGTWLTNKGNNRKGKRMGNITTGGYRRVRIDGKDYRFARLVWLYMTGSFPEGEKPFIDHIKHVPDDDRFEMLRDCTAAENAANRRKWSNNGHPKGVRRLKSGRWQAYIGVNGKKIVLGSYDTKEEALSIRLTAEDTYHGEFGTLNNAKAKREG